MGPDPRHARPDRVQEHDVRRKKKLLEYLKYTSVVNPHARFRVELDDEAFTFERVSQEVIACPVAIQPHPHGIEFGQLKRMAAAKR